MSTDSFLSRAKEAGRRALSMKNPLLVHHYDADGLTSASIVIAALKRAGIPFRRELRKRLDGEGIEELAKTGAEEFIFTDLGATHCRDLAHALKTARVVVMDHHEPQSLPEELPENIWVANCHYDGFNGATDACSATTAYFAFRQHRDLSEIGIVGAIADVQDKAGEGFTGLNRVMLEDAVAAGVVEVRKDLRIFGRASRPLVWFLSYCSEPVLPGLTNNEKACAAFLERNSIPFERDGKWLAYYDLDDDQRKNLASALIAYCFENGVDEEAIQNLVGETYLLSKEARGTELSDAYEFSTMLNACGRHGRPEVGIALCLKEPEALDAARELLKQHRMLLSQGIQAARERAQDFGAFYFFDGRGVVSDTIVGTVANAWYASGEFPKDKPVLAMANDEEGAIKVSGRGCKHLVDRGLDLNEVMIRASEAAGGSGAGHDIAAGAQIPKGREGAFLQAAKRVIQQQIGPGRK
ncbi:MAG TPA: DHH family phosphoesterase [Candidatus Norongarragalinales archaeon]|jgi:RecJ-like exonuclease|nr:DHH family phosphoesterase [Candidatus Norongarragalinales archaeon]